VLGSVEPEVLGGADRKKRSALLQEAPMKSLNPNARATPKSTITTAATILAVMRRRCAMPCGREAAAIVLA
jgi:hypothetical protein